MIQLFILLFLQHSSSSDAKNPNSLKNTSLSDSIVKVWVFFTDKPEKPDHKIVSEKAERRRKLAGFVKVDETDYPVSSTYIKKISSTGAVLHNVYKWENCASFYVQISKLQEIADLLIVKRIQIVKSFSNRIIEPQSGLFKRKTNRNLYGYSFEQLNIIGVTDAHDYLTRFRGVQNPGEGIMLAIFDAGFRFEHKCFDHLKKNSRIKATWDFIDNDSSVYDHDSILNNSYSRNYGNDEHGSTVMSLISGYDPQSFLGSAWGVDLVLARTENGIYDGEMHYEEDNWFSAIVWAESIGVDIVSSSLAYRTDFLDSTVIFRSGKLVSVKDYEYSDLDGKTTVIARAALQAIRRGMVIVNSIGNEGSLKTGTLCSPADVAEVISVGAVNSQGNLAFFSSTGPAADGSFKPDLVAQGTGVTIPDIYGDLDSYVNTAQGTSFSTPMIAGICALIMQAHPGISNNRVNERLFKFCKLVNGKFSPDNYTGRGLPDALLSCMKDNEVYLSIKDTLERPVQFALIKNDDGDSIGMTDEDGMALLTIPPQELPFNAYINFPWAGNIVTINSTPEKRKMVVSINSGIAVKLVDKFNNPIPYGNVYYKIDGIGQKYIKSKTDSLGEIYLTMYSEKPVQLFADADGFLNSDTVQAENCQNQGVITIRLDKVKSEKFLLYPNVIKNRQKKAIYVEFYPDSDNEKILLFIRTIDGDLVWKKNFYPEAEKGLKIKLESELNRLAPGIYFFILQYNNKLYKRKILISS